jgi:hypothetical protein
VSEVHSAPTSSSEMASLRERSALAMSFASARLRTMSVPLISTRSFRKLRQIDRDLDRTSLAKEQVPVVDCALDHDLRDRSETRRVTVSSEKQVTCQAAEGKFAAAAMVYGIAAFRGAKQGVGRKGAVDLWLRPGVRAVGGTAG